MTEEKLQLAHDTIESLEQQLAESEKKVSDANEKGICFHAINLSFCQVSTNLPRGHYLGRHSVFCHAMSDDPSHSVFCQSRNEWQNTALRPKSLSVLSRNRATAKFTFCLDKAS